MSFENWVRDANRAFETIGEDIKTSDSGFVTLEEFYNFQGGSQKFSTYYEGEVTIVTVNGVDLSESQYDIIYKGVVISDVLEVNDVVKIHYRVSTHNDDIYGIRIDQSKAAPEVERIGKMSLHASLPIQSRIRRAIVMDNGSVNYYLNADDSTKKEDGTAAKLNGVDGQIMSEIPIHWRRFDTIDDDITEVLFSEKPFSGAHEVKSIRQGRCPMWLGSFKATMDRTSGKLSSVVSLDPKYRGGNNQSSWDSENEFKSQLGKPVTNKRRIEFQDAAKKRGSIWYCYDKEVKKAMNWLLLLEYANRNTQAPIDSTLTVEGFKKGGLGDGVIGVSGDDWINFNSRYPLFRCGKTLNLGNKTGEIAVTLTNFPSTGLTKNTHCFSYRGIENIYGDIWEWLDGLNVEILAGETSVLPYMRVGKRIQNNSIEGYRPGEEMPTNTGYIRKMSINRHGDLTPIDNNAASSTTYWCDYFWRNDSTGVKGLLVSAAAFYGARAGAFCAYSSSAPSRSSSDFGSRLCIL